MISRRNLIQGASLSALALPGLQASAPETGVKICLEMGNGGLAAGTLDEAGVRRIKQLGVEYVVMGGPPIPWDEAEVASPCST
jgi:hypothetical protein